MKKSVKEGKTSVDEKIQPRTDGPLFSPYSHTFTHAPLPTHIPKRKKKKLSHPAQGPLDCTGMFLSSHCIPLFSCFPPEMCPTLSSPGPESFQTLFFFVLSKKNTPIHPIPYHPISHVPSPSRLVVMSCMRCLCDLWTERERALKDKKRKTNLQFCTSYLISSFFFPPTVLLWRISFPFCHNATQRSTKYIHTAQHDRCTSPHPSGRGDKIHGPVRDTWLRKIIDRQYADTRRPLPREYFPHQ